MVEFDSPIGGKKFNTQSLKEFDVPDETDPRMNPVMKKRGPSLHGPQSPVDVQAAMAFQQRMQEMDDDQDQMADVERQIRQAREAKRQGKSRLNDGAKRRIEMLVGMTRTTREFEIDGNKFVLQTLRSKEMRDSLLAASEFDGTIQFTFEIRKQLLARSLVQIAGLDINQFVGSDELEARFTLIDDLDESLIARLYNEYLILGKESTEKYSIKNEVDAKEVADDLKK